MIRYKRSVLIAIGDKRYYVGVNTFRNMAEEAHAVIYIRRILLFDTKIIDIYIDAFRED
ncbi:DUF6462 family protein [Lacrimispora amygdalina]|uniref:DUF6462 family protein n=1 Tax=Lacrimispora amygdalina TaxID=253257 RepID=UPI003460F6E9